MATQGISGVGLGIATLGGILVYAGFKGSNPIEALRDVASGKPTGVTSTSAGLQASAASYRTGTAGTGSGDTGTATGAGNALVDAARAHATERYSQAKRWAAGYSDCSSFVGKALRDIGITPPGASTTTSYLLSNRWQKISRAQARAGDLAVNTAHMSIFTGPDTAIGQQNPRRGVVEGDVDDVMYPSKSYTVLRYKGTATTTPPRSAPA
jgi:cell wall-associated NlpC family hydrolase